MAAAYEYAEGSGPMPKEIEIGGHIETYGAAAVIGNRIMGAGELRRITTARNVLAAYRSRQSYRDANGNENWAEWAQGHPRLAAVLNAAAIAAGGGDGE